MNPLFLISIRMEELVGFPSKISIFSYNIECDCGLSEMYSCFHITVAVLFFFCTLCSKETFEFSKEASNLGSEEQF
jgi:hypothetical protein